MEQKAGAQISRRAFIQSVLILFVLTMVAGILTLVVPAGEYTRIEVDGRETIDPNSFQFVGKPNYPIWRWFTAPIEVLGSESGLTVIVIIVVLFFAAVLAYIFGDGFSNLAYPTNPVLLICLGLTVVSYPKWMRWTAKLWLWVVLATVAFLGIAVAINFGPF